MGYLRDNFYSVGEIHTPTVLEMKMNGDLTLGQDSILDQKLNKRDFWSDLRDDPLPVVVGVGAGVVTGNPTVGLAAYGMLAGANAQDEVQESQQDALDDQQAAGAASLALATEQYNDYKEDYDALMDNALASLESDSARYDIAMEDITKLYSADSAENAQYKVRIDQNLNKINQDITKFDLVADKAIQGYVSSSAKTAEGLDLTTDAMKQAMSANTAEYNLHKDMFGTTQQNMMDYMNDLDVKSFSANKKAHLNDNYSKVMKNLDGVMAKRNILDSGMYDENVVNRSFELATARAGADVTAEKEVVDLQAKWLQFGEASKVNLDANVNIATAGTQTMAGVKAGDANTALTANTYSASQSQFKANTAVRAEEGTDPFTNAFKVMSSIGANPESQFFNNLIGAAGSNQFAAGANLQTSYQNSAAASGGYAAAFGQQAAGNQATINSLIGQGVTAAAEVDWGSMFGGDDSPYDGTWSAEKEGKYD